MLHGVTSQTKEAPPRPNGTNPQILFPRFDRRKIEASFEGGNVSKDGGVLLLGQRIFGLAQGYEDLNDHDTLRQDALWQSAVHRDTPRASSPTLCRLEKRADRQSAVALHAVLVEKFIASFRKTPNRLIVDAGDSTA